MVVTSNHSWAILIQIWYIKGKLATSQMKAHFLFCSCTQNVCYLWSILIFRGLFYMVYIWFSQTPVLILIYLTCYFNHLKIKKILHCYEISFRASKKIDLDLTRFLLCSMLLWSYAICRGCLVQSFDSWCW